MRPLVATAGAVLAVIAAAAVVFVVVRPAATANAQDAPAAPTDTVSVAAAPPIVATAGPIDPATALRQEALADEITAESLIGSWVPQVSSKKVGLVADGIVYDDAQILADFQRSRSVRSSAILVRSSDYTSFRSPGFWVTVIAEPFATSSAANAWCVQQQYGVDDCFAKRLSHTEGPAGNTASR